MSHRQALSNSSPRRNFYLGLQPLPAWIAILGLVIFSTGCILAGAGSVMRVAFPAGSFAVGVFLYWKYPILYVGFTWWMWFLSPLVRRLVDYQSTWVEPSPILLSPFLVTLVTLVTFLQHLPRTYSQGGLPFVMACTGVFYGFLVGLIKTSPVTAARSLLDWLTPILFGFHLFVNWRDYPYYRQNIQRTFLWGVLVTGVYGVVQYLVAPEWDRFWLIKTEITTFGTPEPFGIRVWSTMHSSGPFAATMMAGLLLLFSSKDPLRIPAAAAGYLAFLLTLIRTMWGAWLLGVITLITSLKLRLQIRLIITILVMAVCVFPLTTIDPFSKIINARLQTFSNLENDTSLNERANIYDRNLNLALSTDLGEGIGNTYKINEQGVLQEVVVDSGILDILFTLGWFGAIPYLYGILQLMFTLFKYPEARFDPFMSAARAISFSIFVTLIIANVIIGVTGVLFWGFLGIGMAANKYYQHQRAVGIKRN